MPAFNPTVLSILAVALCAMTSGMLLESPLLLYLQHLHYTTSPKATFYVMAVSLGFLSPILSTIPLGHCGSRFGAGRTLGFAFVVVLLGMIIVMMARFNKWLFLIGYILYSTNLGLRILRFTIISDVVPVEHRTLVMAVHQLMIPLGAFLAPLIWLVCQRWKGEVIFIKQFLVFDRFTLTLLTGIIITLVNTIICFTNLQYPTTDKSLPNNEGKGSELKKSSNNDTKDYGTYSEQQVDVGIPETTNNSSPVFSLPMLFFSTLMLSVRLILMVIIVLFQPILVHRYGANDESIGNIYLIVSVIGLLPPLMVALLSRFLDDYTIFVIGLILKAAGVVLYLPPFTWLNKWQVIIGFLLTTKASTFCTTSLISLYTKIFHSSPTQMGYMWTLSNIIPVVIQVGMADSLVGFYAEWKFMFFLLPILLSFGLVASPYGRRLLTASYSGAKL